MAEACKEQAAVGGGAQEGGEVLNEGEGDA